MPASSSPPQTWARHDAGPPRDTAAARVPTGGSRTPARRWAPGTGPTSVRLTMILALGCLLLLAAASAATTRHLLSFRVHDYAILNLAGQLREMAGSMSLDAAQLGRADPAVLSPREIAGFRERLAVKTAQFDRIVDAFETRSLSPDLTGLDQPVSCTWDEPSLRQLRATAAVWRDLRRAIAPALDTSATDATVLAVAATVAVRGDAVLEASRSLSGAFKEMMQAKLDDVLALQLGVVVVAVLGGAALLTWLRRRVLQPLQAVEQAALRLVDGDLGVQLPAGGDREIHAVGEALNRLSSRLRLLFDLGERAGAGLTTGELLDTLRAGLRPVVPMDFIGVVVHGADDGCGWRLLRTSGAAGARLRDGAGIEAGRGFDALDAGIAAAARADGFGSVMVLALQDAAHEASAIVFAARDPGRFDSPVQALLRTVAHPVRAQLDRTLSTEALVVAAVEGLAKLAESRDPETGDHLVRMSAYSAMLGAELAHDPTRSAGIDARYVEDLRRFAPMHDIGKVGIADRILLKPGRLTDEERAEMSRHPLIGAEVLRRCEAQLQARGRSVFRVGIEIAEGHHEKWDGSGYPHGLAGEAIPLSARIVAVADVLDALTSKRPYKEAWPFERALAAIDADAGRHFDPAVVAALHRRLPEVLDFYERHKHV